jgi:hypothetical protein
MSIEHISRAKQMLADAKSNHGKIYFAILYGMQHLTTSPEKLSEVLGKTRNWGPKYRYVADLTNFAFSALHNEKIFPVTARPLATLEPQEQDEVVSIVIAHNLEARAANGLVTERLSQPQRRLSNSRCYKEGWPEKVLVTSVDETPLAPLMPISTNGHENGHGHIRKCVDNREIVDKVKFLLNQVISNLTLLNSLSPLQLKAAILDPEDEAEIKELLLQAGNSVTLQEEMLALMSRFGLE